MKGQSRGQIRIIEAFLAVLIIFLSLAISANLTARQNASESNNLKYMGLQVLLKLDCDGSLGRYLDSRDWNGLRSSLNLLLPTGVSFNLTVYDEEMRQVNEEVVSNGGFSSQEVAFVKYVCVSQNRTFRYYVVYLYLAVAK
ncbi:MAG: hypothetical protein ACPLRY_03505 [Candidatus Bathyarchaeales archaeon]